MTAMKSRCSSSALLYIMLMISFIWIRPCFWAVAQGVAGPTEDGRLGWAYTSSDQIWIWYRLTVFQWIIYGTTIDFQKLEKGQYPKEVIISWHTVTYKNFFPHIRNLNKLVIFTNFVTRVYQFSIIEELSVYTVEWQQPETFQAWLRWISLSTIASVSKSAL